MSNISDFRINDMGIPKRYNGDEEIVEIPKGISIIGNRCFENNTKIKKVILSSDVVNIDNSAFSGCSNLETVEFSNSLERIGDFAFSRCTNLEFVDLPNTLKIIDSDAFYGCDSLRKVILPEGLQELGKSAFESCTNLEIVKMPSTINTIDTSTFKGCSNLRNINLNENLVKIGLRAFEDCCSLRSVVIPDSVEEIGDHIFNNCTSLRNLVVGENAFKNWLARLELDNCPSLKFVTLPSLEAKKKCKTKSDVQFYFKNELLNNIPSSSKKYSVLEFCDSNDYKIANEQIKESYIQYVKKQRKKLYPEIIDCPNLLDFMIDNLIIPKTEISIMMEEIDINSSLKQDLNDYNEFISNDTRN